jgi:hypothetical protein
MAQRLQAGGTRLPLRLIAQRIDKRRPRLQLADWFIREGDGVQSEPLPQALIHQRTRLTRQYEVPRLARATQDLACRLPTSLCQQVAASTYEHLCSSGQILQPSPGGLNQEVRRPHKHQQTILLLFFRVSVREGLHKREHSIRLVGYKHLAF